MKRQIWIGAWIALAALLLAGIGFARGGSAAVPVPATRAKADGEQDKMLALGKKIFVDRCAKCHDERGDKALKSGRRSTSETCPTRKLLARFPGG